MRREGIRGSKLLAIWASSARLFDPHLFTCGVRVWTDGIECCAERSGIA